MWSADIGETIMPDAENEKNMCSCGFPQSYPIPHEHDRTVREHIIITFFESKLDQIRRDAVKEVFNFLFDKITMYRFHLTDKTSIEMVGIKKEVWEKLQSENLGEKKENGNN